MLDQLRDGLVPFVERELKSKFGGRWAEKLNENRQYSLKQQLDGTVAWDNQALLKTMVDNWQSIFRFTLGHNERSWASELLSTRNDFAHEKPFNSDDTHRALDTAQRLLVAVSAQKQAEVVGGLRQELLRTVYEEQARSKTRSRTLKLEGQPKSGLRPWREIVTPHRDVASGGYVQAEFAADLAQVHRGEGADEYLNPDEFYRRTFLTEGLKHLLMGAMLRLTGMGGDPVVELQTNFGGGKTHSMLALYHLVGAQTASSLPGIEGLMNEVGISTLPETRRAVLVGTALSPGNTRLKPGGVKTHTLWGELAWQLGGNEGYELISESDHNGTSPGSDDLTDLLKLFSPCLVLIDEWVAYVRQLYHKPSLPAGSFDSNLTFAQALTEAAKAAPQAIVVASLPASQIEIGGEGGQQALDRLKNTFSRLESSWQPATADEGFEIVRRRLFEPLTERDAFTFRDAVIKSYCEMYRSGHGEFPQVCGEANYRRRMEAAFPIHPELFERLYNDWGSIDKFQRTRGVLRLMASVIHALWERNDSGLLISPASVPIDHSAVQAELVRYLDPGWSAVIAKDVDGITSAPLGIDQNVPTLGRYSAARRVARTVYMGSAPTARTKNPGIDDRRIRLGCTQPGESAATFGDALRRLADSATYLYQDGSRYWFSTQPGVARIADDRAAQYEPHNVDAKLVEWLRKDKARGDFSGVHIAPDGSEEVGDDMKARLVILGPKYPYVKNDGVSAAIENFLITRGSSMRVYRNTLVFLAADQQRLSELRQAVRLWMAWSSIADEHEQLNLDAFQRRQAQSKRNEFDKTVVTRIFETWVWALVPHQSNPTSPEIEWLPNRLQGQDPLAVRCSKKLVQEESLLIKMGPTRLKLVLDSYLWQRKNHIGTKKLSEYLASYLYLPRLRDTKVLVESIQAGINELVCDRFAYAGRFDEEKKRYEGLKLTGGGSVVIDGFSVLVKPDIALSQQSEDTAAQSSAALGERAGVATRDGIAATTSTTAQTSDEANTPAQRYFGTVEIDADRAGRDMGRIAEEVLQHLTTLPRSKVRVVVEIEAEIPEGVPDGIKRIVNENGQTLRFKAHGFERT